MIHEFSKVNAFGMGVAGLLVGKLITSVLAKLWYSLKRLSNLSTFACSS